jgi:hypothetical protein
MISLLASMLVAIAPPATSAPPAPRLTQEVDRQDFKSSNASNALTGVNA